MNDEMRIDERRDDVGSSLSVSTHEARDGHAKAGNTHAISIAATFTADLVQQPLKFWLGALDIQADVVMAPYAQVLQELLSPESLFSQNSQGFNILLIRLEDWIRDRKHKTPAENIEHIRGVGRELIAAVDEFQTRMSGSLFVFFAPSSCPPSEYSQAINDIEREIMSRFMDYAKIHCWGHADLVRLYPVTDYEDIRSDLIGHIPFTNEYFVAIATLFARRIATLIKPGYKVIAIDCDNTLWKGVCGEDGASGIELTTAHIEFQHMLVRQHDAGMLLCLCTKNNPEDVEAVFNSRPEMPIGKQHLVTSRINWDSKSSNLRSLAQELDLGLDAFILVDDSPMECADVEAHCASVLTLRFPASPAEILHFVDHTWAFDRIRVTAEARQRTEQYVQNRERGIALKQAPSFEHFLASLELNVAVAPMQSVELTRVAELVQRTNQFNTTGVRRDIGEIEALWNSSDWRILVVHVRDRFGDYGLVGAIFAHQNQSSLDVDTFVLSCRALGRRVEHHIVNELARIAERERLTTLVLRHRERSRNVPARNFLNRLFLQFRNHPDPSNRTSSAEIVFTVPVEYALGVNDDALATEHVQEQEPSIVSADTIEAPHSTQWHKTAYRLSFMSEFMAEFREFSAKPQRDSARIISPRTEAEAALADIWTEVLAVHPVGVHDDFFDLGGDSLLAVRVIARIESRLGLAFSLYEFLEGPTVAQTAARLATAAKSEASIKCGDRAGPVPLAPPQQRLWFIDRLEGGSAAYHMPLMTRLTGELDRSALQAALDALVSRHETLRTMFIQLDGQPMQKISPHSSFALECVDLRSMRPEEHEAQVQRLSQELLAMPFDLSTGPLIRGALLQLFEDEHVLIISMHHIISDGWSLDVLLREFGLLYTAFRSGKPSPLQPLPIQYADYAQWQHDWAARPEQQQQLEYWKEHLQGAPDLLELPTDRPRPPVQSYRGGNVPLSLGSDLTTALKRFSRQHDLTLAMTLYAAWSIVLFRLSGQEDIVVGMPVANRPRTELEGLVGFFVNTLALQVRLNSDSSTDDLLKQVKEVLLGAYAHHDVPFEQVVEALQPARSLSHSPIFQVMFIFNNTPRSAVDLPGLILTEQEVPVRTARFDLSLSLQESPKGIFGSLNYSTDLFDSATIERWAACLDVVLRGLLRQSHLNVSQLPLLNEEERRQLIEGFNATQTFYPQERLVHELFEEQVERGPEAVAVMCGDQQLTYEELNGRANQLARYLRKQGIGPDCLVGLCVERSVEMLIGMLGILKAGGAYVPLDPNYPFERLAYMLKDAAPQIVLTQEELTQRLPVLQKVISLDASWSEIAEESQANVDRQLLGLESTNLAYVIYTSGSTGAPKGVLLEHSGLRNLAHMQRQRLDVRAESRVLQFASLSFDACVWECVMALCAGACLCLNSRDDLAPGEPLLRTLRTQKITHATLPPVALGEVPLCGDLQLSTLIVAGEACSVKLVQQWAPGRRFINAYGPTEATVCASMHDCHPQDCAAVPIGSPIANTQIYILDKHGQVVPIGISGEIYIGGAGVARGYLNQPELTAERFLRDPFSAAPFARMYRTGDLGRWRADGQIEYLGRTDHQVKIRGFRIELGEIEAQLASVDRVKDIIVLAREDVPSEKRLVAYVTLHHPGTVSVEELREHSRAVLPEYMVPSAFVVMDRLPITANGKVDRRALPAPELGAYSSREYEMPRGEMEEVLAAIWQSLLRVERVGRQDNFFELGGHSLLIVRMMEKLRQIGLPAEVRRVFESPILADLAKAISNNAVEHFEIPPNLIPEGCQAITPEMLPLVELNSQHIDRIVQSVPGGASNIQDIYPLAPLQEGILFLHLRSDQGGDAYVLPTVLSVSSRERLDRLIVAFQALVDRHDLLRTSVLWEQLPRPVQVVYRKATLSVERVELDSSRNSTVQINEWIKPAMQRMDLRQAPLVRLRVAPDPHGEQWYVLLQLHHVIGDNLLQEIVISEVVADIEGRPLQASNLVPYRNHIAHLLAYARGHDADAFFRSKLADVTEPTAPFGLCNVHGDGAEVEEAHHQLDTQLAIRIRTQARRLGVSAATLFHAAWGVVVAHTSGRDDVVFGSVLLGRLHGNLGAQRGLGMFINTLPLRLQMQDVTAEQLVRKAQRELIELLDHEHASLAAAQRCSGIAGSAPLFTALLNYRHRSLNTEAQWSGATGIQVLARQDRTNYPITLTVDDFADGFTFIAQTDHHIDSHRVLAYLITALRSIVGALEENAQNPVLALQSLPPEERRQIIELFNATEVRYPKSKLIHELFEEQVERTPHSVAVMHEQHSLTYAQINSKANQLAHALREKGVGPDHIVGICVERSPEMIIGLLGILKAGGAYLPLDPNYPAERLAYMMQDAQPRVILVQSSTHKVLPVDQADIVVLSTELQEHTGSNNENLSAAELGLEPRNLLYVIYTSGSTGRPKGTAMPHGAMLNLIEWHRECMPAGEGTRVLQFAPLSFDVAFQEIFSTLCTGGTLMLLEEWVRRDTRALMELLRTQGVARLFVPPLMLQSLAEFFQGKNVGPMRLQDIVTAGEQLRITPEIVNLFKQLGRCRLHNHYGPTETHVVTALTLVGGPEQWPVLPTIGRPIANTQIYVLNAHRQPVPLGVVGEIYIGGANIARGYLHRPELTAERFVHDPFNADPDARMYRTGDLGRWRADSTIEYLGRNDDQVKIRGFRIELGEIEAQLVRHEEVRQAAVVAREDTSHAKRLIAYLVPRTECSLSVEELRAYLKAALPEHMVPSGFVVLDSLPLTPSGKVDRRALPSPALEGSSDEQYEPPQGEIEQHLATILKEVLGLNRVGREDNFFDLGGHSLLILKLLFKVEQSFGCALTVADVYNSSTLRTLAERISGGTTENELVDLSREAVLDDAIVALPRPHHFSRKAVLLTGATGFVGRFLLARLLQDTGATFYCPVPVRSRRQATADIRATLLKSHLWHDGFESRIVAIPSDVRRPNMGLSEAAYQDLSVKIDTIYHSAATTNTLETYEMARSTNVGSVRELLKFATHQRPKLINHVSTLGVFTAAAKEPERVIRETDSIDHEQHSIGLTASRWVAEKVLISARQRGVPCNIFRLGLIWADSKNGCYDEDLFGYRLLKSCLLSGIGIENYRFSMVPTPIDYMTQAVAFLANHHESGTFHISSNRQVIDSVFERCVEIAGISMDFVPTYYDWIKRIKRLYEEGYSLPIVPLVQFAFPLDRESFYERQRSIRTAVNVRFDFTQTHRELEHAGIVAPEFDNEMLRACLMGMFSKDPELRQWADVKTDRRLFVAGQYAS